MSDSPLSFDQIKSAVLGLPMEQRRELLAILYALNTPPTKQDEINPHILPGMDLYEEIRRALNSRYHAALPDLRTLRKRLAYMPSKIAEVDKAVMSMIETDLPRLTRQQHTAVKQYVVSLAIDYLTDRKGGKEITPTLESVLNALAVPTQLVDEQFPGYRRAGVLRDMLVQYVTRKGA